MKNIFELPMVIAFEKNFPEAILAGMTLTYGLWVMFPPDRLQFAQGYGIATTIAPSWAWGLVFAVAGILNFYGILVRRGNLVRATSRVLSFMWFTVAFLFAWSAIFSPGWILILCVAILYAGVGTEYRTKTKWHDATDALGPDL